MTAVEAMASSVTSDVVAGDPAASTGPASGALYRLSLYQEGYHMDYQ
jgi:hypothetical protein